MRRQIVYLVLLVLGGCSQGGSTYGVGREISLNQHADHSTVRDMTQNPTFNPTGSSNGGSANTTVPVNLALDPASFDKIFNPTGSLLKKVTAPSADKLKEVQQEKPSLFADVQKCLANLEVCTVTK